MRGAIIIGEPAPSGAVNHESVTSPAQEDRMKCSKCGEQYVVQIGNEELCPVCAIIIECKKKAHTIAGLVRG